MMPASPRAARGMALIIVILLCLLLGSLLLLPLFGEHAILGRHIHYRMALMEAREALIGFALTYRETHPDQFGQYSEGQGYLPCPDFDNDGVADPPCGAADISQIGRLPWRTLGLSPLRDGAGECLWYAVSGHGKDNPKSSRLNWDTPSQLTLWRGAQHPLGKQGPHGGAFAAVLAPNAALAAQTRPLGGPGECPGDNMPRNYLEGIDPLYTRQALAAHAQSIVQLQAPDNQENNDDGIAIELDELFKRISQRAEFKNDIDNLLNQLSNCLNRLPPGALPAASPGNKGMDPLLSLCPPATRRARQMLDNWRDNLLYAHPASGLTVNNRSCPAVLLFAGARTANQIRSTEAEIGNPANYLEGGHASIFPGTGNYSGPAGFDPASPSTDLVRCITGLPGGATQLSFDQDLASFRPAGQGAVIESESASLLLSAAGSTGGCLWFPTPLALAGKSLTAIFSFQFGSSDNFALDHTGTDRGYGLTLQLLRSDWGSPAAYCGRSADMGSLGLNSSLAAGNLGLISFIMEYDLYRQSTHNDPTGNHLATLLNGNLTHSSSNGGSSRACNGSAAGCELAPGNTLEEAPSPRPHLARVEVVSGCDASCTACQPNRHAAPRDFVRIRAWLDCRDCQDIATTPAELPATQRCTHLDSRMNSVYFGLTGGLRTGAGNQSLSIRDFVIRSE